MLTLVDHIDMHLLWEVQVIKVCSGLQIIYSKKQMLSVLMLFLPCFQTIFIFAVKRVKCSADCSVILFYLPKQLHLIPRFSRSTEFNNLQQSCTFEVILMSLVQYDKILSKFGQVQQLQVMVNYECGFNQLEMGKYFESIITSSYHTSLLQKQIKVMKASLGMET